MSISDRNVNKNDTFSLKWYTFGHIYGHFYIMVKHCITGVLFAPLYIKTFQLSLPHTILEAEKFNITYSDTKQISTMADKLRWYRYKKGLHQKEVAEYVGIERATYAGYENAECDYYPIDKVIKIAKLFGVEVIELLDEYNAFLYRGQGAQIRELRIRKGLSQKQLSQKLNVSKNAIKRWENESVRITKRKWTKLFFISDS